MQISIKRIGYLSHLLSKNYLNTSRLKHLTVPMTKPTAFCKMLCALFTLELQSVPRNSNKYCRTPSAGEVPSLCCSASAVSSPGDQQALLTALQTARVQVAAPWPCFPPSGELSQQYLISHKCRNQHLHKDNKAALSPCSLQFSTRLGTATLEQISVSALHEE